MLSTVFLDLKIKKKAKNCLNNSRIHLHLWIHDNKSSYFVVSETKGKIEFRFSNTIDKDDEVDIKQIMERFYRSPSNKKEGSGVGLSIAQEIINLHKGKIVVDKNGSVISFVIRFN